ncbi:hypothetical protein [Dyella thiooxydans]|nr:hypothetical protein [Dyella thiooxydans]
MPVKSAAFSAPSAAAWCAVNSLSEGHLMQLWRWNGANDSFTTLVPVNDADLLSGVFTADGTSKTWGARPRVKPAVEKDPKKQLPLGDLSFIMGASVVLNDKAYAALGDLLRPFGEFLELDLVDAAGLAGGDQRLHFYNVTRMITCIDVTRSEMDGKKVIKPAFLPDAVPDEATIFKDPLRKKADIYLNGAARDALVQRMEKAGLRGSTLRQIG